MTILVGKKVKITVKVVTKIHDDLVDKLDELSLKRDNFLNLVLKSELNELEEELKDKKLSHNLKNKISLDLATQNNKIINLSLDEKIVKNLNHIVKQSNIVRDAFFNRLMYFILCTNNFKKQYDLPENLSPELANIYGALPFSPLDLLAITIKDPLFFLRQSINENNLYCFRINNFLFLSCYDEEEEVKSDDL